MKKEIWCITLFLLLNLVFAENLYQYDDLETKLEVNGIIDLVAEKSGARLSNLQTTLTLFPENYHRQQLLDFSSSGVVQEKQIFFEWNESVIESKQYGFESTIKTANRRIEIDRKVPFPLLDIQVDRKYLSATEKIDRDDPDVIRKAAELAEGEDDLFKVVFNLLKWTEENVEYDLNTLTAEASQKASWVLEHRQGVCDEMSSLFIAMCRSLGIPARFVSGVSYTTSDLFTENWLPHGWAEVYFPDYGWVSFDPAFNEYGYVDVTHIKLRDSLGPGEPSTHFEWLSENVALQAEDLEFSVDVLRRGIISEAEIEIDSDVLGKKVNFGSYNLIETTIKNNKGYYIAPTLRIAAPPELEIKQNKKVILLEPFEEKEIFWILKVEEDLADDYWYTFPITIYSEKNISQKTEFVAEQGEIIYTLDEVKELSFQEEDKKILSGLIMDCVHAEKINLGAQENFSCIIKNTGNTNLENTKFCLGNVCKKNDLLINQEQEIEIKVLAEEAGWQKILASAENGELKKSLLLEYVVIDEPQTAIELTMPKKIKYGENYNVLLNISKISFSIPKQLEIVLERGRTKNKWTINELKTNHELVLDSRSDDLSNSNKVSLVVKWQDEFGNKYREEREFVLEVEADTFGDRLKLILNRILNLLS